MGSVETVLLDGIANITFGHPEHNSLPGNLLGDLQLHIQNAGESDKVKVVVLRSTGDRTFCAGANFRELAKIQDESEGLKFFMGFANVIDAIRTCPKFVICRVQGKAVGGGVGLLAAADYVMATKWGSIRLSELSLGIGPFVIGPAVERKVGVSIYTQLAINASEWQTAEWARDKGLYNELFDTSKQLDDYLDRFLEQIGNYSADAMQELKRVFWEGTDHWPKLLRNRAMTSGKLLLTQEAQQAIQKLAMT